MCNTTLSTILIDQLGSTRHPLHSPMFAALLPELIRQILVDIIHVINDAD
jgi:hypothetical protein